LNSLTDVNINNNNIPNITNVIYDEEYKKEIKMRIEKNK